jgi:hypothetical protein
MSRRHGISRQANAAARGIRRINVNNGIIKKAEGQRLKAENGTRLQKQL